MVKQISKSLLLLSIALLALNGPSFAKGGPGAGGGKGSKMGSMYQTCTQSKYQTKSQQRLRDGSGAGRASTTGSVSQKGHYGVADGTGTPLMPQDGTGFGSPANR